MLYRLDDAGYQAHLVGGGVRDLLLGREPKDFDVATDATPDEVRGLFRNCRLIGRRFRLAHVHFGREIIEVATFRAPHDSVAEDEGADGHSRDGMIVRDNVFGSMEEDAFRRDFTVNALYYDIADFSIVDYVGGMEDIRDGNIRLIGDPATRYREDPVRMLRAVRFMAKLGFQLDPQAREPIFDLGGLLESVPAARLFEEALKLFLSGHAVASFERLRQYDLFGDLFPETDEILNEASDDFPRSFVLRALENTDDRIEEGKPVTPVFLFAALLWPAVRNRIREIGGSEEPDLDVLRDAAGQVLVEQRNFIAIPKRLSLPMREIWDLQLRLQRRGGRRAHRLLSHPRFRAAYDFLCLRAAAGEACEGLCDWWTQFQDADAERQKAMIEATGEGGKRKRKRRRKRAASETESSA